MSYTQLRAFHAVAEMQGFTAAARRLNVSQSTITLQVRELERRYKVELFHRKGRSVMLTQTGKSLFQITFRLVQAHSASLAFLDASRVLEAGTLRIAAVGPFHATDMAGAFKTRYPGVEIIIQFGNSQDTLNALLELAADVAILAEVEAHPDVEMEFYSGHKVVVFVHRNHRFYGRGSIRIDDLRDEKFILRETGSTTRRAFETAIEKHGVAVDRFMEIGSREGVWKAVRLGLGISVVADFEFVPASDLHAVTIEDVKISTNYYIAYLRNRSETPLVKAFKELTLQKRQ